MSFDVTFSIVIDSGLRRLSVMGNRVFARLPISRWVGEPVSISLGVFLRSSKLSYTSSPLSAHFLIMLLTV